jgi:hypothetical protein
MIEKGHSRSRRRAELRMIDKRDHQATFLRDGLYGHKAILSLVSVTNSVKRIGWTDARASTFRPW